MRSSLTTTPGKIRHRRWVDNPAKDVLRILREDIQQHKENSLLGYKTNATSVRVVDMTAMRMECHRAIARDKVRNADDDAVDVSVLHGELVNVPIGLPVAEVDLPLVGDQGAVCSLVVKATALALTLTDGVVRELIISLCNMWFRPAV